MSEILTTVLPNPWLKNYSKKIAKKEIAEDFYGIFAIEDIKAGEYIFKDWNDSCAKLTLQQVKKLPLAYRIQYEKYSTEIEPYVYVGPHENEDISEQMDYFINHSCEPSAWLITDGDVVARRDIKAGEQVTIDYATFIIHEFASSKIEKCLCGSAECRGAFKNTDWWKLRTKYKGHFISWIQKRIDEREKS